MTLRPDPKIKGSMVLVNWIKYKQNKSDEQIQDILGYKSISSVKVLGLFSHQYKGEWEPIPMSPECFLWNWQSDASDFLRKRQSAPDSDREQINSIILAISGTSACVTRKEATKWMDEVNSCRRK